MRRLVFLAAARRDLSEIARYLAIRSSSAGVARAYVSDIRDRCARLAGLPGTLGVARPEFGEATRMIVHGSYVILFRYHEDTVRVQRIFEGHRDLPALFSSTE